MDMRAPYPATVATTLYLYDGATPEVSSQAGSDHIAVEVASLRIAAWTPDTLRRLADTLSEAANILDSRLARIDALSEGSV